MWGTAALFFSIVTSVYTARWIVTARVGDRVELDLAPGVVTWKRHRSGHPDEYIKYCDPVDKRAICDQFVTANNRVRFPITNGRVLSSGVLVIYSYKPSDAGFYSSPDHEMEETIHPDGVATRLAGPQIELKTIGEEKLVIIRPE
ncbi:unnamed protein product [Cylicostephanus goldi]|uniref:DOMON domain-containing protein n=1 Tax=Cylicostephanus goldi TaxID=71465 RepID=A0A3P6RJL9_CYLGO|nr:unnamed protein product [Cylicostephanus goldi]